MGKVLSMADHKRKRGIVGNQIRFSLDYYLQRTKELKNCQPLPVGIIEKRQGIYIPEDWNAQRRHK